MYPLSLQSLARPYVKSTHEIGRQGAATVTIYGWVRGLEFQGVCGRFLNCAMVTVTSIIDLASRLSFPSCGLPPQIRSCRGLLYMYTYKYVCMR